MKRNFLVSLISGFAGFMSMLMFLSVANSVNASGLTRSAEVQPAAPIVNASSGASISTTFTYQGQLKNNGSAVNGLCDFQFGLWNSASGGAQVSGTTTQTVNNVAVTNGLFSVPINFGLNAFNGDARYLAIAVACPSGSGYTPMTTRQALTPVPYALYALNTGGGGSFWSLTGNTGINSLINFLGTTDAQPLVVKTNNAEALYIDMNQKIGIGTNAPVQLLHMNVITGQGEGMEIDSLIAGHAPAVYLNHTGNLGRNFRIASYGDNNTPGSFRIRDETAGSDRLVIDAAGNIGINTAVPSRTLDVNGVIGIFDHGGRMYYGGLASEVGGQLVDIGINDDSANRFGGAYNSAAQGGLLRIDTRGYDLFQFFGRPAGSSSSVSQLASLNSSGKFTTVGGFNGKCRTDGNVANGPICNQDVAEAFATTELTEPGDVIALDARDSATPTVRKATGDRNELLVGVVSTNPGLVFDSGQTYLSGDNSNLITAHKTVVAALGRVPVKVSLENGSIAVGDPLTAASIPGAAMKATQAGQIIGYALQSSDEMKEGKLLMWLQIGAYLPPDLLARVNDPFAPAAEIATLQSQVAALQQQNAALEARLTALEHRSQTDNTAAPAPNLWSIAPLLIGGLVGLIVVRRPGKGGAR